MASNEDHPWPPRLIAPPELSAGKRHLDERQPEPPPSSQQQAADVIPAALPKQVTTTKEKKLPEPEILYPAVLINKSNILETVPLTVKQPWLSPHSILGWPLLIDVDRPAFREWEKRIGNE
jgi:hypothetical protein